MTRPVFVLLSAVFLFAGACTSRQAVEFAPSPGSTNTTEPESPPVTDPAARSALTTALPEFVEAASFPLGQFEDDEAAGRTDGIFGLLPNLSGQVITMLGPMTGGEAAAFEASFVPFEEATGADIIYRGTSDDTSILAAALEAGEPPDLVVIAQPGQLLNLASSGDLLPVPQSVADLVSEDFGPFWSDLVTDRAQLFGVPNKASVKSLVWFQPERFASFGYEVPTTWEQLEALSAQMRDDGLRPWCIGISSGDSSGWVFTDWLEDVMLRLNGPMVYDQWVNHEISFADPRVVEAVEFVSKIWFTPGNVLGGRESIARTGFDVAGLPVLEGGCMMHKQASFYASNYVEAGAEIGPTGDVDAFYFPTISEEFGQVVLGAGDYISAFTDREATYSALAYFASSAYANAHIESSSGGFISPNLSQSVNLYGSEIDRRVAAILVAADPFRFDGSDLMPAAVGSDEFWRSATAYVAGAIDVYDFVDRTEAAFGR